MHVRFKGGATRSLNLPAPVQTWDLNRTKKEIVSQIDELLGQYTDAEIADILNKEGKRSGMGLSFGPITVGTIRRKYGLKSRYERLREQGLLTLNDLDPWKDADPGLHEVEDAKKRLPDLKSH